MSEELIVVALYMSSAFLLNLSQNIYEYFTNYKYCNNHVRGLGWTSIPLSTDQIKLHNNMLYIGLVTLVITIVITIVYIICIICGFTNIANFLLLFYVFVTWLYCVVIIYYDSIYSQSCIKTFTFLYTFFLCAIMFSLGLYYILYQPQIIVL
jgi:hypothetical protein